MKILATAMVEINDHVAKLALHQNTTLIEVVLSSVAIYVILVRSALNHVIRC